MTVEFDREVAVEISEIVVEAFSDLYPDVKMTRAQWDTLRDMIERQITAVFGEHEMSAKDFMDDPLYRETSPTFMLIDAFKNGRK